MDAKRLAEIKAREAAATKGPWMTGDHVGEPKALCTAAKPDESLLGVDKDGMAVVLSGTLAQSAADAAFIAHAREDIPIMLSEIERLSGELERGRTNGRAALQERERLANLLAVGSLPAPDREARARELYERAAARCAEAMGAKLDPLPWGRHEEHKAWWCTLVDVIGEIERERQPLHVLTVAPDGSQSATPISLSTLAAQDWDELRALFVRLLGVDHAARHLSEEAGQDGDQSYRVTTLDFDALQSALDAIDPDEGHDEQTHARAMAMFDQVRRLSEADRAIAAQASIALSKLSMRQPLTWAETEAWAGDIWEEHDGWPGVEHVAGALLAANRGDIPAEVRPGTVMLNGGGRPLIDINAHGVGSPRAQRGCPCFNCRPNGHPFTPGLAGEALCSFCGKTAGEHGVLVTDLARAHLRQERDPLALDPEDGTLCGGCRAPRNAIHSPFCPIRAGVKVGRVPAEHQRDHIEGSADEALDLAYRTWEDTMSAVVDAMRGTTEKAVEPWTPKPGDRVRTVNKLTGDFGKDLNKQRRPNEPGAVFDCYVSLYKNRCRVRHDDGTEAPYDQDELGPEPTRLCVAVLVTDPAGRVLLVRHRKRAWELPGGGVHEGEEPCCAAFREVREETGIQAVLQGKPTEIAGTPKPGAEYASRILVFRARGEGRPKAGSDVALAEWFSAAEVLKGVEDGSLSDLASRAVLLEWARGAQ